MTTFARCISLLFAATLLAACSGCGAGVPERPPAPVDRATLEARPDGGALKLATFAGGCFWCMEPPFEGLPGVYAVVSGFTGGKEKNPA